MIEDAGGRLMTWSSLRDAHCCCELSESEALELITEGVRELL